jgi:hypothetical protein
MRQSGGYGTRGQQPDERAEIYPVALILEQSGAKYAAIAELLMW